MANQKQFAAELSQLLQKYGYIGMTGMFIRLDDHIEVGSIIDPLENELLYKVVESLIEDFLKETRNSITFNPN